VLQTSLKLTDQQKHELMELRRWILPRIGRLMRERERISKALQACTKDTHKQASPCFDASVHSLAASCLH